MLVSSVAHSGTHPCKCGLAAEVLRRFGQLRLRVTGASMLPAVWPGDIVTVHSVRLPDVSRGDLVLFFRGQRFLVHRVLNVSDDGLQTRGDSVLGPDPPVHSDELLGRVVSITGAGGPRTPSQLGVTGSLVALAARHSTRVCNILLRLHALYRQVSWATAVFPPEAAWSN